MKNVPASRLATLALRQLLRDARAGELRVLFFALLIAVAASTAIGYFGARLNDAMLLRATEFLGADLVLRGSAPAEPEQVEAGEQLQLQHARVVEFSSVVATDDNLQLTSVKAADDSYPLRGELRSAAAPYQPEQPGPGPQPGEAWAEARLFAALNLQIGDQIEVGNKPLRLTRVLTYEPDRVGDFYSLTPRVLMHLDDLEATGVVQPGSRVSYRELWRGSPEQLGAYEERIKADLQPHQRIETAKDGNRQIGGALGRAERYLNLASLAAVLLAGVAVALSAARFAARRFDASALLRCLGLSRREALMLYSLQLAYLGLFASTVGALLGWAAQHGLFFLLRELVVSEVPPATLWPALAGIATGLVALAGFALPPLAALGRVPPLRVLRRDMLPIPPSSWLVYGAAVVALGLIMWRLSLDLKITLALLGGGLLATAILGGLLLLALKGLRRALSGASLTWRLGLGQLLRHPLAAAGQSLAFGLILLAMALIGLLRGELLDTWQNQLPDDAPNHFVLNVLPADRDAFAARIEALSDHVAPLYPVVPGRLVAINGEPVRQLVSKESQGERAIRRDLSLTWAQEIPADNRLTAGQWWPSARGELPGVSVEAELAESLQVQLGDRLSFTVGGLTRDVSVTSLREVNWDSFQPNFYMIFEPQTLEDIPATYMTSFHLPEGKDRELVQLARDFPSATILQVEALLSQLRSILSQVSLAVEYVLMFVLAAGLAVLFAGLQATLDERIRQGALLRALGAERTLLIRARRTEFGVLGAASGVLAALGCELVSALLYHFVFDLRWQPHPWLLLLPLIGALLVGAAGVLGTRRALNASPLNVLREN
ncbi:ABC transporter permease [Pseudomonas sp. Choline-3u-10]|jgi:putative ABC transport system permease protein|uniref:ABC transporter permease n=1 Tax=Pseudomonadaceae TaxID=135621 RepID=UPI00061829A7|nr:MULTISPECIES: FtsX-like permease family protein [Pseudomonadaceae]MAL34773.1 ABC transporter permease [Pseudomonas sp.]MBU0948382.1 FtsX-like permease family protein [Gammaproteobacteria bacterium]KJJ61976.1 ABC transporter permease [Pseudomonas sp. 10B238]MBK3795305.1 FtsX-like permease family protein [Stutzerimonas stutzeri]MBK3878340.1 FtsX-like permease family protein [Stutzerimonas stutzeri]|tara:strand:- start:81 stop:2582 length:2502 start_codon:yes stop_codon:yes gene_type:complete